MMQLRSISRELALLVLGQTTEKQAKVLNSNSLDALLNDALQSLMDHWREGLDDCAKELDNAQQNYIDSDLDDLDKESSQRVRIHLNTCLTQAEVILNSLSTSLEMPRILAMGNSDEIRTAAINRINLVLKDKISIDQRLDSVMEGWRLKRLPRIDRDILRLAVVDLVHLETPIAVACNEAVDLAHRYSDDQGRRMINGVLRRLQNSFNSDLH